MKLKTARRFLRRNSVKVSELQNPLPNVVVIQPKIRVMSGKATPGFVEELQRNSEIETIKMDLDWISWSYDMLNLVGSLSFALILINCHNILDISKKPRPRLPVPVCVAVLVVNSWLNACALRG